MSTAVHAGPQGNPEKRVASVDWAGVEAGLDERGFAVVPKLLGARQCDDVMALFPEDARFRKHVIMAQHGYGCGEYEYFAYPLPGLIARLRETAYPYLAELANRWNAEMSIAVRYPATLGAFLERCHQAGQTRPTALLPRYDPGDYNRLHQDFYGEHAFPLQMAILLSAPGEDFSGGEFIITEQRPRMQARAAVVPLGQGDAVVFAVNNRPVKGARGFYRVTLKHGVSDVLSGRRYARAHLTRSDRCSGRYPALVIARLDRATH